MDIVKLITDKTIEISKNGKLDKIIENNVLKCVEGIVSDSFRWNGEAKKSIEGQWEITNTNYTLREFSGNNFESVGNTQVQTGQLGYFDFGTEKVTYSYYIADEDFNGIEPYTLKTEKVNAGFTRATNHTLTINDKFVFNVTFEDGTKNAEKNAKEMILVQSTTVEQPVFVELKLKKK